MNIVKHNNNWCWGSSTIIIIDNGAGFVHIVYEDAYPGEATITGLSVIEKKRNLGYGSLLMQLAEKEINERGNINKICLRAESDKFTYEWYKRLGYVEDESTVFLTYPTVKNLYKTI